MDIKFKEPEFEEPEYDSERNDEPGMINGLTSSEMDTVIERVSDGRISDRERADAAMLMLGMAGGELPLLFATFRSLPDAEHQAIGVHSRSLRYSKIICKTSPTLVSTRELASRVEWAAYSWAAKGKDPHATLLFFFPFYLSILCYTCFSAASRSHQYKTLNFGDGN